MRSDDRDLTISIIIGIIGAGLLYFFFFDTLDIGLWLKILLSLVSLVLLFFLVLGLESKYDFYKR